MAEGDTGGMRSPSSRESSPPLQPLLPTIQPPDKQAQARLIVLALVSSNLFALFLGGLYEFLTLRGIVNVPASRIVLLGVWAIGVAIVWIVVWNTDIRPKKRTVTSSAVILAALLWGLDEWTPKPKSGGWAGALFLNCQTIPLPLAYSPNEVRTLVDPARGMLEGRWFVASAHGWPPGASDKSIGRHICRCELTNHASTPMFNGVLPIWVKTLPSSWDKDSHSLACIPESEASNPATVNVNIPEVGKDNGSFTFYLYNSSNKRCIDFGSLGTVTLKQPGKQEETIRLVLADTLDMKLLSLGPMEIPGAGPPTPESNPSTPASTTAKTDEQEAHAKPSTLYLSCEMVHLPMSIAGETELNFIDADPMAASLSTIRSAVPFSGSWPEQAELGDAVYRCELENYADAPVFAVKLSFKIKLARFVKGTNSSTCGEVATTTHDHSLEIVKIDPHRKSVFFLSNESKQCADFVAPASATLEGMDSRRLTVGLKPSSSMNRLSLFPMNRSKL